MTPKRVTLFVCVMATIAVLIHGAQVRWEHRRLVTLGLRQEQDNARRNEAQRNAAIRAQFLSRYFDPAFARKRGGKNIAIVAASENGALNPAVAAALANRFKREALQVSPSFFKPAFVSEGLFQDVFRGSRDPLIRLDLGKFLDGLVLAREDVHYLQNSSMQHVITANMLLKVTILSVPGSDVGRVWTFSASSPGFSRENARQNAEVRLIGQINSDTSMSLNAIVPTR